MNADQAPLISSLYLIKCSDGEDNDRNIEEILKPVGKLDLDSSSDYSDLSDIFEEFHKENFMKPNTDPSKKRLSKVEGDWRTVGKFTDEFKKTMVEVRQELDVNYPLFNDDEEIEKVLSNPPAFKKIDTNSPISPRDSCIIIEPEKDQWSATSSQSLVWQRLLKNSQGHFKVSPPMFDVFRQEEKHWLERPPISWKLVDDCRIKCDKWLDDVAQVGTGC